ncbi:MAG: hypothetical protein CSA83_01615 [Actinomycetales bacterium]|nr:MAG: hypothetical protein CSA83_01615 [Actinomycetales bacterium]
MRAKNFQPDKRKPAVCTLTLIPLPKGEGIKGDNLLKRERGKGIRLSKGLFSQQRLKILAKHIRA